MYFEPQSNLYFFFKLQMGYLCFLIPVVLMWHCTFITDQIEQLQKLQEILDLWGSQSSRTSSFWSCQIIRKGPKLGTLDSRIRYQILVRQFLLIDVWDLLPIRSMQTHWYLRFNPQLMLEHMAQYQQLVLEHSARTVSNISRKTSHAREVST